MLNLKTHNIIIEIDEKQLNQYNDEYENNKKIIFISFNHDIYIFVNYFRRNKR